MEEKAYELVLLVTAPLTAVLAALCAKLSRRRLFLYLGFFTWLSLCLWALASSFTALERTEGAGKLYYAMGAWEEPLGIVLELNGPSWIAVAALLLIASALWLISLSSRDFDAYFFLFFALVVFTLNGIFLGRDLFNLFVLFEILSLSAMLLIAYDRSGPALLATLRYLMMSTVSIMFFLFGLWIIYRESGSLALGSVDTSTTAMGFAAAALYIGLLTRGALIPFHSWLPEAHTAAPYPASALLSGFVVKAPLFVLLHLQISMGPAPVDRFLVHLGLVSALAGGLFAFVQRDAKKVLAYLTVSQMGLLTAGFAAAWSAQEAGAAGAAAAAAALLLALLAHGLYKSLLFLSIGELTHRVGSRDTETVRGLFRLSPLKSILFFVGAASLAALPFSAGYGGKFLLSKVLASHPLSILAYAAAALNFAALVKLSRMWTGRPSAGVERCIEERNRKQGDQPSPIPSFLGHLLLAGALISLGIFPQGFLHIAARLSGSLEEGHSFVLSNTAWYSPPELLKLAGIIVTGTLLFSLGNRFEGRGMGKQSFNTSMRLMTGGIILFILLAAI
jgi:formate hydrogenlyase subunit 3/multisubunit Na+/H+ antiporter MnhD subunit